MSLGERLRNIVHQRCAGDPTGLGIQFKTCCLSNAEVGKALENLRDQFGPLLGVRALVLLPDSLEAYLIYLHFFMEGAVLIPVSIHATETRIQHVCDRVQPDVIITNDFLFRAHQVIRQAYRCLIVRTLREHAAGGWPYEIVGSGQTLQSSRLGQQREREVTRFIIFTSGSTGVPKGVCLSESNVLAAANMMVQFLPLEPSTRSLVTVPLYDYYGMIQVFGHILGGAGYSFGFNTALAGQLEGVMASGRYSDLVLVPHTLRALLSSLGRSSSLGFKNLRRITTSSDILTEDILQQAFQINPDLTVVNIYGLTEAGRACYRHITRRSAPSRTIGRPSPGVEIEVQGNRNNPGEIIIRGPNVMLGYLTGIENDQISFKACTEVCTRDLGYYDEQGEIVLLGRQDHMINLMGMKVHPCEIEGVALKMHGITDARAEVLLGDHGMKTVHLKVVCHEGNPTVEQILEAMRANLPRPFVPTTVSFERKIERTDIGAKIIR